MDKDLFDQSALMARLTISALRKASRNKECWSDPIFYRVFFISGLTVLLSSTKILTTEYDITKKN
tara:strand:- start:2621 stop:2815 length:195 start_codon:yes stop_codon:yes gene_type:complete